MSYLNQKISTLQGDHIYDPMNREYVVFKTESDKGVWIVMAKEREK